MMYMDFLGELYFAKNKQWDGFLIGAKPLAELQKGSCIVFGAGINGYICKEQLLKFGVEIKSFCENALHLHNRKLGDYNIVSSFETFRDSENYYIIAMDNVQYINVIRAELQVRGIESYSVFVRYRSYQFDCGIRNILMDSINFVLQNSEDHQTILPKNIIYSDMNEGIGLGRYCLSSLLWWHDLFIKLQDDFSQRKNRFDVLEIGAGFGLLSYALKKINPNFNLDWLSYGEERVDKYFQSITQLFPGYEYNNVFGIIENTKFAMEKQYDVVIMTEVFEHFATNPVPVMIKIRKTLRIGALLYLSTPNWYKLHTYEKWQDIPSFDSGQYNYFGHNYHYNQQELREIFTESGFEIVSYSESVSCNHNFILRSCDL